MIFWSKQEPTRKIADILKLEVKKDIPLVDAAKAYLESPKILYPSAAKGGVNLLFESIDKRRKIGSIVAKDAMAVFAAVMKKHGEAEAFRARATLTNVIRFSITGEVPTPLPRAAEIAGAEGDVGKLVFRKAKFADVSHLVPLYSTKGRFGWIKAEVQKMIFSLEDGECGYIDVPTKRNMNQKEADAITHAVTAMFSKSALPWVIKYNPNESAFIVMREADFKKLTPKAKGV